LSPTVLGLSAFYHDSAAALVQSGKIVAAAHEERFSRIRHDPSFPRQAINYCLEEAFIEPSALDAVVFYDSPILTLDRILRNCLHSGDKGRDQFELAARSVLGSKLFVEDYVQQTLGSVGRVGRVLYTEHHFAHGASAFYPSPFKDAAIISLDGVGEWTTTAIGHGESANIALLEEIHYPHSLGLLYSAFTSFCGFKVNSGEYKLMGLAAYGEPRYTAAIHEHLVDVRPDGSYRLNLDYFSFQTANTMTSERFNELFGGVPRVPESRITRREIDLAASIQKVTTEIVLAVARRARALTASRNVTLAGGVALNCVSIGELVRSGIFDEVWVQPAAGDAGGALGAALLVSHSHFGLPRNVNDRGKDLQRGSCLGPKFTSQEVRAFLERHAYPYDRIIDSDERAGLVADTLAQGNVVAFFSGRMEFGPRALGARSILGDPRSATMQTTMNQKIKHRESFRPFAPAVLTEDVAEYFDLSTESPYMLITASVRAERRLPKGAQSFESSDGEDLIKTLRQPRSDIPAVTHIDYSARVQTVSEETNPEFYRLIRAFKERTGFGVIVNTSFNLRGEPIVCSPKDAYNCFMRTGIDLLVLEDVLLWKVNQPPWNNTGDVKKAVGGTNQTPPKDPDLGAFYELEALPVAARVRARGRALLAPGPDASIKTYWTPRATNRRQLTDFEGLGARTPNELEIYLHKLWTGIDLAELCDLAPGLAELARKLRQTESQDPSVSGLVYAMF
jgi:carbamoyltransferase